MDKKLDDILKRLGRIERNQITSDQVWKRINPDYEMAERAIIEESRTIS